MTSTQESERENHRVIVLGEDRTEVLLVRHETGLQFPSVAIPRWQRLTESLTSALKDEWNCDVLCSFSLKDAISDRTNICCEGIEGLHKRRALDRSAVWVSIRSLSPSSFKTMTDYLSLQECLLEYASHSKDPDSHFARRGWFHDLRNWIAGAIRDRDLELSGPFRQFSSGPQSSLIRFETSGPAIWFKAVGKLHRQEFGITLKLAELFPRFIPEIIAQRPDWHGWLTFESKGRDLNETQGILHWSSAARRLAELQIESVSKVENLIVSGVRDLRSIELSSLVRPFFEVISELMQQQTKLDPPPLSDNELCTLQEIIQDRLAALEELRIPDSLGHLDLNPGNVLVLGNKCVFLDWAEAYVGNPFLSFEYLREQFRRHVSAAPEPGSQLLQEYRARWERVLSAKIITEALALVPLLAVFAYAVGTRTWKDEQRLRNPTTARYLRSLARRMNRTALKVGN